MEKYGEHAVYELAELLRISGDSVYAGGGHGVNRDLFGVKRFLLVTVKVRSSYE